MPNDPALMSPLRRRPMATALALGAVCAAWACSPGLQHKTIEMEPIGTVPNVARTPVDTDDSDSGVTTPNSATPSPVKENACAGTDFDSLDDVLKQCDVPMPKQAELPTGLKEKLEVKITPSAPKVSPGGHLEVAVVFRNKSTSPLDLYFSGDPNPHFDLEALDAKGRRADLPTSKQPKSSGPQPARDAKASKVTLGGGGSARLKVGWDAVKTKWAPELAKSWEGRGFPRAPAGPLSVGKYTLRLAVPLIGDLDPPKTTVDVGL